MAQLPEQSKRHYRKWDTLAERAVEYAAGKDPDDRWIKWPDQHRYAERTTNTYRSRVNSGEQWGLGFHAATRNNGVLWIRYVGDLPVSEWPHNIPKPGDFQ